MIESDPEDDTVKEVGSVAKDTSGFGSESSELEDRDVISEFMPTRK